MFSNLFWSVQDCGWRVLKWKVLSHGSRQFYFYTHTAYPSDQLGHGQFSLKQTSNTGDISEYHGPSTHQYPFRYVFRSCVLIALYWYWFSSNKKHPLRYCCFELSSLQSVPLEIRAPYLIMYNISNKDATFHQLMLTTTKMCLTQTW